MLKAFADWLSGLQGWQQAITVISGLMAIWGFIEILGKAIAMLGKFVKWLYHRTWEGRENWSATSTYIFRESMPDSDPNRAFDGNKRIRWSTLRPQEEGVSYTLDIGKERKIVSVEFDSGVSLFQYPAKFELLAIDEKQIAVHKIISDGPIRCMLQPVKKIRIIHVKILEPQKIEERKSLHWSIHDIRLREQRLWGLWNAVI